MVCCKGFTNNTDKATIKITKRLTAASAVTNQEVMKWLDCTDSCGCINQLLSVMNHIAFLGEWIKNTFEIKQVGILLGFAWSCY